MSDYSAKPSGSLARIGDYDLSSDDSDHNDEEEVRLASKPIQSGSVEINDVAVAEATPAEVEMKSSNNPVSGPEPPSAATEENKDELEFNKESGSTDKETETENKKVDEQQIKEEEEEYMQLSESVSAEVTATLDRKQEDLCSSAEDGQNESQSPKNSKKAQNLISPPSLNRTERSQSPQSSYHSPDTTESVNVEEKVEFEPSVFKGDAPETKATNTRDSSDSESSASDDEDELMEAPSEKAGGGSEFSNGKPQSTDAKSSIAENPWESPRQYPVNGIVQPRTEPPEGKPTRHTNCLDFVLFTVVKDALKHKHSWPFQFPVDANKLEIPEYHNVVTKPMDLRTIEKRLRNLYYWCAEDAIKDINQLFTNCYTFNPPEYDIYKMAKTLEKQVLSQLTQLPRSEKPAELADHHRRGMFSASTPSGKTKGPKQRGRKSTRGRKKTSLPRGATSFKDESMDDMGDDASSKVDSVNFDDDEDTMTEKDVESRAESVQPEIEEPKPSTSQPPSKKRKAENGESAVSAKVSAPPPPVAAAAPAPAPRKNPNTLIDWKSLVPRWHGKQAEWQKFCSKLLNEIHSVRNKSFAQVFYQPVDPIKLKIFDYLDIITNPMDLHTIKKKLDFKQYAEPDEFAQDMNLMVNNCCTYNPKGSAVHQNAVDMKSFFDSRWKLCPRPGVDPILADSYINQNLVVNTDLIEDERINSYLSAVKAEEKKCAEKLEQLRTMSEGLYSIATLRREAKLAGNTAPSLAPNQLNQLEKLGISIKSTPMMIPELISPALSVRSSTRAPVPKIIDDIGPSPIKARKISKPRTSVVSNTSVVPYAPTGVPRGRKPKKSGRPKKNIYSSTTVSPAASSVQTNPFEVSPYVSIYGRRSVGTQDKIELSERMSTIPHEYITPVLRIIQIGAHNSGKNIASLRSLCEEEIDFNDVSDDLVIELLDYLEMIQKDKTRAERVKQELEVKAKFYGFEAFDNKKGLIPKNKTKLAPPPKPMRSESPSPSASRAGSRSSDSDSESDDSSDDEPSRPNSVAGPRRAIELSGNSSRASTPAGPSRGPASSARPAKGVSSKPSYTKRTLSESSSSSDSNGSSSDSSDSDSEPKPQVKKPEPPKKPPVVKKPAPPPPKKKAPLSILDELLPDTPGKKPVMASVPTTSRSVRTLSQEPYTKSYQMTDAELEAQRIKEHNEALQRQAEARRRRALEDQPQILNQHEVMQEFESQYGDFSY